ncbi:MAG: hypothetical protein PF636_07270, partial [Actinomycetota bacterium]|nr:hypothetical protein [Actinomycetota bacterium]
MAKAGFCSECGSNVWLDESGRCPAGHGAECIQNVYEAEVPPLATPQAAASVASESREPTAAASGRGKKTAVILAITTLVVVGLAFGGFRVYDALLGEEPILEVAADYDAAVFENDWDRLKGFTRFSDW